MKKLNVGDRVRMIEKGQYSFDRVGNTGTVIGVASDSLLEITVDGEDCPIFGKGWTYWVENENWEVIEEEVKVQKFKVGDKVKVVRLNSDFDYLDYPGEKNIGMVGTIHELLPKGCTIDCDFEVPLWFHYGTLELVQNEKPKATVLKLGEYKIVFNGDTTVVTDGTRKGVAKRHPDDEYDAVVGLQVALERFNGGRKPKIGDKVRVLKVDDGSRYGRHGYPEGQIVEVVGYGHKDTDIICMNKNDFRQTLIAGEYEVLG